MIIEYLKWDSDFFGYKIGKILIKNNINIQLNDVDIDEFDLVYVFSPNKLINLSKNLIDEKVTLSLNLKEENIVTNNNITEFKYFNKFSQLIDLAFQSGVYSRFKKDINFVNNEFERLYIKWITNSVVDKKSLVIFIYELDNKILGFVTVDKKTETHASIGLIAVDQNCRGQGIGLKLINQVKKYLIELGYKKLSLTTQGDNLTALKFYFNSGFIREESIFNYHIWKKK